MERFAGSRVSHHFDMLALGAQRYAHQVFGLHVLKPTAFAPAPLSNDAVSPPLIYAGQHAYLENEINFS
jgi:hypothetical protein